MGLIYLVRKKKFRTAEGIRELYFAIQRKLQKRGGKNEEDLAEILSANSSRSKGEVLSILTDLPDVIEEILKMENPYPSEGWDRFMPPLQAMASSIRKMYCLTRYGYPKYISLPTASLPNVSVG